MLTVVFKHIVRYRSDIQFQRYVSTNCKAINKFTDRTHNCGDLTIKDVGKRVKLYGWLEKASFNNKIVVLKDSYGSTQCVLNKSISRDYETIRKMNIHLDSVLKVTGLVRERPEGKTNVKQSTGNIEVISDTLEVINHANSSLPIQTKDHDTTHNVRLKYRYLDLRRREMQEALRFKSQLKQLISAKLTDLGFVDIETPTLSNRTPGGANEFIVPSQEFGRYYSLVQSPQQFKQLLMIGGLDRYFQICRCYRDESTRPDRQPEFTQVDIELSFTNQESIMHLIDELLHHIFNNLNDAETDHSKNYLSSFDQSHRLPRMSFKDAFKFYGSDKPDLRFDWKINDLDETLSIDIPMKLDQDIINGCIQKCNDKTKNDKASSFKLVSSPDELTIIETQDKTDITRQVLGTMRTLLASELVKLGHQIYTNDYSFIWITDFPLFTKSDSGAWEPTHHPFTAPSQQTLPLIDSNIDEVIGQHYDLVLNGQEIAGGSIRIHDHETQRRIFDIIDVDSSLFSYFLEALKAGCPPHGGIAIGLDRLISILLKRDSIRDTIAFPKSGLGKDLMTNTPHELADSVLKLYHQRIN